MVTVLATVPGMSMYPDVVWNASSLCNLAADDMPPLPETTPDSFGYPRQWINEGSRAMDESWQPLWSAACQQLSEARAELAILPDQQGITGVLAYAPWPILFLPLL